LASSSTVDGSKNPRSRKTRDLGHPDLGFQAIVAT
jgi:hypothetical protein